MAAVMVRCSGRKVWYLPSISCNYPYLVPVMPQCNFKWNISLGPFWSAAMPFLEGTRFYRKTPIWSYCLVSGRRLEEECLARQRAWPVPRKASINASTVSVMSCSSPAPEVFMGQQ
eukprot:3627610-Amphidinium_carterae.2